MQTLTDTDAMPFGKHKGDRMQDVPAQYLLWLRDQMISGGTLKGPVWYYIEENLDTLLQQNKKRH